MEERPHKLDGRTVTPKRAVSREVSRVALFSTPVTLIACNNGSCVHCNVA